MKKQVCEILDFLDDIKVKANYEKVLERACKKWLANYMRRKYS